MELLSLTNFKQHLSKNLKMSKNLVNQEVKKIEVLIKLYLPDVEANLCKLLLLPNGSGFIVVHSVFFRLDVLSSSVTLSPPETKNFPSWLLSLMYPIPAANDDDIVLIVAKFGGLFTHFYSKHSSDNFDDMGYDDYFSELETNIWQEKNKYGVSYIYEEELHGPNHIRLIDLMAEKQYSKDDVVLNIADKIGTYVLEGFLYKDNIIHSIEVESQPE